MIMKWTDKIINETKFPESSEQWKEIEWSNGDKYEGEFKDGSANGKGT